MLVQVYGLLDRHTNDLGTKQDGADRVFMDILERGLQPLHPEFDHPIHLEATGVKVKSAGTRPPCITVVLQGVVIVHHIDSGTGKQRAYTERVQKVVKRATRAAYGRSKKIRTQVIVNFCSRRHYACDLDE